MYSFRENPRNIAPSLVPTWVLNVMELVGDTLKKLPQMPSEVGIEFEWAIQYSTTQGATIFVWGTRDGRSCDVVPLYLHPRGAAFASIQELFHVPIGGVIRHPEGHRSKDSTSMIFSSSLDDMGRTTFCGYRSNRYIKIQILSEPSMWVRFNMHRTYPWMNPFLIPDFKEDDEQRTIWDRLRSPEVGGGV